MVVQMMSSTAEVVAAQLPYLRRYARALTGNQGSGDRYALSVLEAVLADPDLISQADDRRLALFQVMHSIWSSSGAPVAEADFGLSLVAQAHMTRLTPHSREALLLSTIEGFSVTDVGKIIGVTSTEAGTLIDRAVEEMSQTVLGKVMVIEDEAVIAMDLTAIVEDMGHSISGVARTRDEAVAMALADRPDLILADIQLADNSSGIDAVNDILSRLVDLPVIFVTAFPEKLLTGERPEPAFLINKPYTEEQVRSAVSQAMFFASTETLVA